MVGGRILRSVDRVAQRGKNGYLARTGSRLAARRAPVELLNGDEVRKGLSSDLGFDRASRGQHARRVTYVAKLLARAAMIPIVARISPYASSRAHAREQIRSFVEAHIRPPSRSPNGGMRRGSTGRPGPGRSTTLPARTPQTRFPSTRISPSVRRGWRGPSRRRT
jgi:hypothetical protein